jgi:hypothetical protein
MSMACNSKQIDLHRTVALKELDHYTRRSKCEAAHFQEHSRRCFSGRQLCTHVSPDEICSAIEKWAWLSGERAIEVITLLVLQRNIVHIKKPVRIELKFLAFLREWSKRLKINFLWRGKLHGELFKNLEQPLRYVTNL